MLSKKRLSPFVLGVVLENFSKMEGFFETLKPSFMSASKEPMTNFLKEEQPEEYQAIIERGNTVEKTILEEEWEMFIDRTQKFLAQAFHEKIFFATIQDSKDNILGFSTFLPVSQKKLFSEGQKIIGERKNILLPSSANKYDLSGNVPIENKLQSSQLL